MNSIEGRIVKAIGGFYYVLLGSGEVVQCRSRGVLRKRSIRPLVGDLVQLELHGQEDGTLTELLPRRNQLTRPAIVNVDQALLVSSLVNPPLSLYQLDKTLVMIEQAGVEATLIFTKLDLPGAEAALAEVHVRYAPLGYNIIPLRLLWKEGLNPLRAVLAGRITVMAGQSGVGKSTILRNLIPESAVSIAAVSLKGHRGRHTTTHVELFPYNGGFIADTPGFSQFDFSELELAELPRLFVDIRELASSCEFRGCLHESEQGCAVREAVQAGKMAQSRYENYRQMLTELKDAKARRY